MRRLALTLALVAAAPAWAAEELPVIGWQLELHICRSKQCRALLVPLMGEGEYRCRTLARALQARAVERLAAEPASKRHLATGTAQGACTPLRGLPRA